MKRFLVSVFVVAFVLLSVGQVSGEGTNRPLAVAIVTSGGGSASVAALVAQAEVALSRESNVAVVDRAFINRILDEQLLGAAEKAMDADQAVRLGKILKADLFAVIDVGAPAAQEADAGPSGQRDELSVFSLVVFDVSTGRRYWDAALPGKIELAVPALVQGVLTSVSKSRSLPSDLQTVSVLPVRNVGLPRDMDAFCETIGLLLERQLTLCSRVAVLERGRLEHARVEQGLPGIENDLQSSLLTLEAEASRHEDGKGILIKVLLRVATGKTHAAVQVTQPVADAREAVDGLLKELQPAFGVICRTGNEDRRLEAKRFRREAGALRRQGSLEAAIRAGQAACALDPALWNMRELAMNQLVVALTATNTLRSAQLIRAAAMNLHEGVRRFGAFVPVWGGDGNFEQNLLSMLRRAFLSVKDPWLAADGEAEKERALAAEECRTFQEEYCLAMLDLCMQGGRAVAYAHLAYAELGCDFPSRAEVYNRRGLVSACHLLDGLARHPNAITNLNIGGFAPEKYLLAAVVGLRVEKPQTTPENQALRKDLLAKIRSHPIAAVRAFAHLAELHDGIANGVGEMEREKLFSAAMEEVHTLIKTADVPVNQQPLVATVGVQAIQMAEGRPENRFADLTSLWESLLTNNVTISRAATPLLLNGQTLVEKLQNPNATVRLRDLVRRTLELDDIHGGRILGTMLTLCGPWSPSPRDNLRGYMAKMVSVEAVGLKVPKAPTAPRDPLAPIPLHYPYNPPVVSSPPWQALRPLLRFGGADVPGSCSYPSLVRNGAVFVTVMPDDAHVTAVRVPLQGGSATIIGTAETGAKSRITCMDVDEVNMYVGTESEVILFPLSGGPVKRFRVGMELPQSMVNGLASVEGKLYVGMDNYIVAWQGDNGSFRLVACNGRRERGSPFDDREFFHVDSLFADPVRKRFLAIVVVEFEKLSSFGSTDMDTSGVWEYRCETGKFRRLTQSSVGLGCRGFRISDREIGWGSGCSLEVIDLERDSTRLAGVEDLWVKHDGMGVTAETFIVPRRLWEGNTAVPVPWLKSFKPSLPPGLVFIGERMWMCEPFSRLTRDGEMDLIPEQEFGGVIGLHVLEGGKEVLITARNGLWIVTL